jgi:hypothetical protein
MRVCRMWGGSRVGVGYAWLALLLAGVSLGVADASARSLGRAAPTAGRELSLARAPVGLRAAVRRTLGAQAATAGYQTAELTASDGVKSDQLGYSVAIARSTAVVGAPDKSSGAGAAYVFVHTTSGWSQQAELTASNGAADDHFGFSVAISGSTVVVGALGKNSYAGTAYVFIHTKTGWSRGSELTASDHAVGSAFGASVAIDGLTAVVGAPDKSSGAGAAYVFVHGTTGWSQQAELTASDGAADDSFGYSVAISGSTAVIGADGNNSGTGAAYVFVGSGGSWSQQAELTASDGLPRDLFGHSVAISGSTVEVGAPDANTDTGAAYVFVASGSTWSQQAELTASDGAEGDYFGSSVAISGSTLGVGADGSDSGAGAAYVFVSSGSFWSQQAELTASDAAASDEFAQSVAISGSTVVVGAPGNNASRGAAYVFVLPSQQAELTASDGAGSDRFGYSVALSGSTAVVGADGKNSGTGAAYVFVHTGTGWSQQAELTASDGAEGDEFGFSVGVSGSTVMVGAPGKNSSTGTVYVFLHTSAGWSQKAELTASDHAAGNAFGASVAIDRSTAVVGAPDKSSGTGAAYVFVRPTSSWSQRAELTASDAATDDFFGDSVAISGSTPVIGADGNDSGTGAAYVFLSSGSSWSQQAELIASDGAAGDLFGRSVAISGSTAVIGADANSSGTGAAYVFALSGSTWSQQAELTGSDAVAGDEFGYSVAISGSTVVVGAPAENSGAGATYVFVLSGSTWSQQAELTASDAAAGDEFGSSVAMSGSSALVGAPGNSSSTGAAYVFTNV